VIRAIRHLARRIGSQRGSVALPAAVGMLVLTLALGAVAVTSATRALDGSNRDIRVKRAVQAANTGLETALWRTNTLSEAVNNPLGLLTCAVRVSGGAINMLAPQGIGGAQWCPQSGPEEIGSSESFSYRISALADVELDDLESTLERTIVATGTSAGVTRRVTARATALDIRRLFGDYTVFSDTDLNLSNQADVGTPEIQGNARSNGNIFLNHPGATVHGDATPGPAGTVSGPGNVTGSTSPALEPLVLPPVTAPPGSEVDGNNCRTPGGLLNLVWVNCSSGVWNASTRRLTITGSGTYVMSGNVHSLCSISVSNSATLIFTAPVVSGVTQPVRVYIDSPANCGGSASFTLNNNPTIRTGLINLGLNVPLLGSIPSLTNPTIQLFAVGNSTVTLNNNTATPPVPLAIYAPQGTVTITNYARVVGGVAAGQVSMSNNSEVVPAGPGLGSLITSITPLYTVSRYKECSAAAPSAGQAPDQGC
jgi:hypothetical protein